MTNEEALEKLELDDSASQQEIKQQYQEFYNEFQMRVTNAPTTHQKTLYQRKLKQLETAYLVLTGSNVENRDTDLPGLAPTEIEPHQRNNSPHYNSSKEEALKLLGLKEPFTTDILEICFKLKKRECEDGIQKATNGNIAKGFKKAIVDLEEAKQILTPFAKISTKVKDTKKNLDPIIWVLLALVVLGTGLFVFKPWASTLDPAIKEQFTTIKAQGDLLATQKKWNEALEKYTSANKIIVQPEVQDSIASLTKLLSDLAIAEETIAWEKAKTDNNIDGYSMYLDKYTTGKFIAEANTAIEELNKKSTTLKTVKKQVKASSQVKKELTDSPEEKEQIKKVAEAKSSSDDEDIEVPFSVIESVPVFPGCENASNKRSCFNQKMQSHIAKNFQYPEIAQEMGVQGRVSIQFTIQKDGSIGNIKSRAPDINLENEARRIISLLPRMKPGMQRGKKVRVPFSIPINFKLE